MGLPCDLDNSNSFNGNHVPFSVNIHDRYRTNHIDFGNTKRFSVAPPPGKISHLRTKFVNSYLDLDLNMFPHTLGFSKVSPNDWAYPL